MSNLKKEHRRLSESDSERESRCKKEEKKRKEKKEQVQKRKMKETQPQFLLQYFFLTNKNKNIYVKSSTCAGS